MSTEKNNNHLYLGFFAIAVLAYLYFTGFFNDEQVITKPRTSPSTSQNAPQSATPRFYMKGIGLPENALYNITCPNNYFYDGRVCMGNSFSTMGRNNNASKTIKSQDQLLYDKSQGSTIPDPGFGKREWTQSGMKYYPRCPPDTIDLVDRCSY